LRTNGILITKSETLSGEDDDAGSGAIISNGDDLDGGLIEIEGTGIIELDSIDSDDLDFIITDSPAVIDGGTVIFDRCNSGA
jgi:hypothetical protein